MNIPKATKKFNKKYLNPVARVILYPVIGIFVGILLRIYSFTLRSECINKNGERPDLEEIEKGKQVIYAFWHGRQFYLFYFLRKRDCSVMTSLSEAGELQKWVLRSFGHSAIRGSSTKGGVSGLVKMIKAVKSGKNGAFAVDGPGGPPHSPKPGVIQVAAKSGGVIIPVSVGYRRFKEFTKLWDLYRLPMPFSKTVIKFGNAVSISSDLKKEDIEGRIDKLKREIDDLTTDVDNYFRE